MTQEAAYRSQLGQRRARVHRAVARATADLYRDRLDERAALLAYHWEAAGDALEAARWHRRAAEWVRATDLSAAVDHWRRVRSLLEKVPESTETVELGLMARTRIIGLSWTFGVSPEEGAKLCVEGEELARRGGDVRSLAIFLTLHNTIRSATGGAFTREAVAERLKAAAEAVRLADESDDPATRLGLRVTQIAAHYEAGRVREALAYDEQTLRDPPADIMVGVDLVGVSPYIWFVMFRGILLTTMGRLDHAARELDRAVELARAHDDFEVLAQTHAFSCFLAWLEADEHSALAHAHHALEIAEKTGSAFSRVLANHALGEARLLRGEPSAAVDALEHALAIGRDRQAGRQNEAMILSLLAEAHLAAGDPPAARETAERAVALAHERGMRMAECAAQLAVGRLLLRSEGVRAREAIDSALAEASSLVGETGAKRYAPFIHLERAELARRVGDDTACQRELSEAHRLFAEMGATTRAERVAQELAATAAATPRIPSTHRS